MAFSIRVRTEAEQYPNMTFRSRYKIGMDVFGAYEERSIGYQGREFITVRLTATLYHPVPEAFAIEHGGKWAWDGTMPNGWEWEFHGEPAAADAFRAKLDAFLAGACEARCASVI